MEKIYGFVPFAIQPGKTDAFIEAASECHKAALVDLTGTQCYEWFLNADGTQGYVIEVYDDPAAVAHHSKMMSGRVEFVRQVAEMKIHFAGDVPLPLQDRMRAKLGEVDYLGPRAFGRMSNPSPDRTPPLGDERIYALAWFRPREGKAAEFLALARQSYETACEHDPGTYGYEWFFDDHGNAIALDIYRDPAAMMVHMANCGSVMQQILQIVDCKTIVFGALPPEVEARLRPELGISRFPRRLHGVCD